MSDTSDTIITVANLRKSYSDIQAVRGISFRVQRNEVFGLLGPNGAGKTTTLEMLEGLIVPDGGSAQVAGFDVVRSPQSVKARIGIQLQSAAFFSKLKLYEMVRFYGRLYGLRVDADALLRVVGLQERRAAYFDALSGGQKQRFSIAIGLVNRPDVLFLDEPTTGLDPTARRSLWALIKRLQADGYSVILTTHYMEEAEELCTRVGVMDSGRIIALDTPTRLIDALLAGGFRNERVARQATLEDVFIELTGKRLDE